jgi:HAD superfamily hydrolase (TIGR01549 family)
MEFITVKYKDNPARVREFFELRDGVYRSDDEGKSYSTNDNLDSDHTYYTLAVEDNKLVGGIRIEISGDRDNFPLQFHRKEVFDTVSKHLPFLVNDIETLSQVTQLAVLPEYRQQGVGLGLLSNAFAAAKSLGSDLTLTFSSSQNVNRYVQTAAETSGSAFFGIGTVDLISDNWVRARNMKIMGAIPYNPKIRDKLEVLKRGDIPWQPKSGNKVVFGSIYDPGSRGLDAVLLDWDNVMIDDVPVWASAISRTLMKLKAEGEHIPDDVHVPFKQPPIDYLTNLLGSDLAEKALPILLENHTICQKEINSPLESALQTIRLLKKTGVPYAIVSNKKEELVKAEVNSLLPEAQFGKTLVIGGARKPDKEKLLSALNTLGVAPSSKVLMVGDSGNNDIIGARNAGIRPVLFSLADINIVNELSDMGEEGMIGFVKDHRDLQRLISAELRFNRKTGIA